MLLRCIPIVEFAFVFLYHVRMLLVAHGTRALYNTVPNAVPGYYRGNSTAAFNGGCAMKIVRKLYVTLYIS